MNTVSSSQPAAAKFEELLDQQKIAARVVELGKEIAADYASRRPVLVGVLKGCLVFMADLMRAINLPVEIEFVSAASYREGRQRAENIILGGGVEKSLKGRHVLLIDGVVDSARTVSVIMAELKKQEPASLEIVTLLNKPGSHRTKVDIRYKGFSIGNEFVIGYGLDNTQRYRNMPYIGRVIDD